MDTIAQLIERLQKKAEEIGEDTPVAVLNELEFWNKDYIKYDSMYCTAIVEEDFISTGEKVLLIGCGNPCINSIRANYNKRKMK